MLIYRFLPYFPILVTRKFTIIDYFLYLNVQNMLLFVIWLYFFFFIRYYCWVLRIINTSILSNDYIWIIPDVHIHLPHFLWKNIKTFFFFLKKEKWLMLENEFPALFRLSEILSVNNNKILRSTEAGELALLICYASFSPYFLFIQIFV